MDLQKLLHEIAQAFKGGHHPHLLLFAGLFSAVRKQEQDSRENLSDLGDLGDNVPMTLLKSLSSRRMTL